MRNADATAAASSVPKYTLRWNEVTSAKRWVNGTPSRNANRIWVPVWATRTSCSSSAMRRACRCCGDSPFSGLIGRSEPVPAVQLEALGGQLGAPVPGEPGEDRLHRLVLGHAGLECLLAPEAGGDPQRLAAVLAERREHAHEELPVGDRLSNLERGVPGGEHVQVVLVEVGDRLGVVGFEVGLGDLVDPGANELAEELPSRLATHGFGDDSDGITGLDEAQGHRISRVAQGWAGTAGTVGVGPDGKST